MTPPPFLRHDETLFRNLDAFEHTFVPDHLYHRDAQLQELAFLLQPALRGGSAGSAVLRGTPGTGKTTTVRRIFTLAAEEGQRIAPAYINCRHDHTQLAVYRSIFEQVCGCPAPPAGRYLDEIKRGIAAGRSSTSPPLEAWSRSGRSPTARRSLHNPIKDIRRCGDYLHLRGDEWIRELGEN